MKRLLLLTALLLATTACGDDFADAQSVGTIDAFEEYLENNPNGRFRIQALAQLETMYLDQAQKGGGLEMYDRYLERFPEGDMRGKAVTQREKYLFDWALEQGDLEAWDKFLTEYPKPNKKWAKRARRLRDVAAYVDQLSWTDLVIEPVNMAEDPKGPKDGWGFSMQVTNNGTKFISDLRFTIDYLGPKEGQVLKSNEWPVVAKNWGVPMEEEKKLPMKPGQTRTWFWSDNGIPEIWEQKARVTPTRLVLVE